MLQTTRPFDFRITSKGCFECLSHKPNAKGYPVFKSHRKSVPIHRYINEQCFGPLGKLHSLHTCDNTLCINPEHLYRGTNLDNIKDKTARGRAYRMPGEDNPAHKLTENEVREIRSSTLKQRELAAMYGVSQPLIGYIKRGEAWKHVI